MEFHDEVVVLWDFRRTSALKVIWALNMRVFGNDSAAEHDRVITIQSVDRFVKLYEQATAEEHRAFEELLVTPATAPEYAERFSRWAQAIRTSDAARAAMLQAQGDTRG